MFCTACQPLCTLVFHWHYVPRRDRRRMLMPQRLLSLWNVLGLTTTQASFATSWYFLFRTIGCLSGAYILTKVSPKSFFTLSVLCMVASMAILFFFSDKTMLYTAIALVGFGNSNVFSIISRKPSCRTLLRKTKYQAWWLWDSLAVLSSPSQWA